MAQMVKNLPAKQETQVQSLGQEDLLEKGMATHSSILAWRIPWREEPHRLYFMGLQRVSDTNTFTFHFTLSAYKMRVLNRPGLLVENMTYSQDVLKE